MSSARSDHAVPAHVRVLQVAVGLVVTAFVVWTLPRVRPAPGFSVPFDGVLQGSGYVLSAALAVLVAVARRSTSLSWWLVVLSLVLRAVGFAVLLTTRSLGGALPYPSVADLAWASSTVVLVVAVLLRLREVAPRLTRLVVLDAVSGSVLVLGVAVAVLVGPVAVLTAPGTPRGAVLVNVGYPVIDVALLVAAASLLIASGRGLQRGEVLLLSGIAVFVAVDVTYFVLLAEGLWRPGTLISSMSLVATAVIATAVLPARPRPESSPRALGDVPTGLSAPGIAFPIALTGVALVGMTLSGFVGLNPLSVLCLGVVGVVSTARGVLTLLGDRREAGVVLGTASEDLRRFQALVEASSDLIGMADADGNVTYINPAGRRLLGMPPDTPASSITVSQVVPGTGRHSFATRWERLLRTGSWTGESRAVPIDGSPTYPVAISTFMIRQLDTGEPFAVATIQRDITELKRIESEVRELAEERARLLTRLVQAQEDERSRIAADVHDDSVQSLAVVDLRLGLLRRRLEDESPALVQTLDEVAATVSAATDRLRHLLFDLETPARETRLSDALTEAAAFVFADTEVHWEIQGARDLGLAESQRITAYRVVKEALTNAHKHAGAGKVVVELDGDDDEARITVRDDGRGIRPGDEEDRPGHLGLSGMRDRAQVVGGELEVGRGDQGGTVVRLRLPTRHGSETG